MELQIQQLTLKSGLRIANFSSFHPFHFDTGEILPGHSKEWCDAMSLEVEEKENKYWLRDHGNGDPIYVTDIELCFNLGRDVSEAIRRWYVLWEKGRVDIVLMPLPVARAWEKFSNDLNTYKYPGPFRIVRVKERACEPKIIYSDRFCI